MDPAGILEIVLCRPPANALTVGDLQQIASVVSGADRLDNCRVVLLRAEGKGFNAGGDLKEMQSLGAHEGLVGQCRASRDACQALSTCAVPVVVAVHGHCLGLGLELVGCCDVVVASADARLTFGRFRGAPHGFRMFGPLTLRYFMLTGERMTASDLHRHGAAALVVGPSELTSAARCLAAKIAAKDPAVLRRMKAALDLCEKFDSTCGMRFQESMMFELEMIGPRANRSKL